MHHAEELPALHLAEMTLAQAEGYALELVLRLHLQAQLSTVLRQATDGQDIVDDNGIGQKDTQLIGILVAHSARGGPSSAPTWLEFQPKTHPLNLPAYSPKIGTAIWVSSNKSVAS